jgi:hypothetical protein
MTRSRDFVLAGLYVMYTLYTPIDWWIYMERSKRTAGRQGEDMGEFNVPYDHNLEPVVACGTADLSRTERAH